MRVKQFVQQLEVSPEFFKTYPKVVEAELRTLADEQTYATGPRGGRYRLLPVPVKWNMDEDWMTGCLLFWQKRQGRYVRPQRRP